MKRTPSDKTRLTHWPLQMSRIQLEDRLTSYFKYCKSYIRTQTETTVEYEHRKRNSGWILAQKLQQWPVLAQKTVIVARYYDRNCNSGQVLAQKL
jgi:hypothetical protein